MSGWEILGQDMEIQNEKAMIPASQAGQENYHPYTLLGLIQWEHWRDS